MSAILDTGVETALTRRIGEAATNAVLRSGGRDDERYGLR